MNLFANLNIFGKKKETSTLNPIDTIQKLKEQVIILNKRNNCVEQKIAAIMTEIKEVAKTNQQKALLLLDKKKTYDEEIHKNDCASILLEKQISALETSVINKQVTDTLRNGNIFVKKFQQTMNIDNIEDLMDDIKETADTQKTISEIFSNQVQNIYDDEDLLNELNRITNEEEVKQEPEVKQDPELKQPQYNFPNVPMNHEDEQELVLLQQSLLL
jgi:charged multivesicular body protein 4